MINPCLKILHRAIQLFLHRDRHNPLSSSPVLTLIPTLTLTIILTPNLTLTLTLTLGALILRVRNQMLHPWDLIIMIIEIAKAYRCCKKSCKIWLHRTVQITVNFHPYRYLRLTPLFEIVIINANSISNIKQR